MSGGRIGFVEGSRLTQASFAAAALTGQQMTQVGAIVLHSTVFGEPEAFGGATR